jgi:hypothetical protein
LKVLGNLEPIPLPETFLTIPDLVETHAFKWGGNRDKTTKIPHPSVVAWVILE